MQTDNFNRVLEEKYHLVKSIATDYNYNEELTTMLTLIYMAFYMNYGKESDMPLYDIFRNVKVVYDKGTVSEVAAKNGFSDVSSTDAAVTIFTPNLNVFKDSKLKQNPQTIILGTNVNQYLATPVLKLELLAHEVRHAFTGYFNTNKLIDKNTYYMRSGFQESYYTKSEYSNKVTKETTGRIFDEIANTHITGLLVNMIMNFKNKKITNKALVKYLQTLKTSQPDGRYRPIGYDLEIKLLYPLLTNEIFINSVDQHSFDGDIEIVKGLINANTSLSSYNEFCELLDVVSTETAQYQDKVSENDFDFINQYVENVTQAKRIVVDLKNNIGGSKVLQKTK